MRCAAAALLLVMLAPAGQAQDAVSGRVDGFTMLNETIGVIVTGLDGIPGGIARAIVTGFIDELGQGGRGADLLNAGRVIVVRGIPAKVGGSAPGLVIDWRVSMDGGSDIGALYSAVDGAEAPSWAALGPEAAANLGREVAARFRRAHFTAAIIRATGEGAILLE